MRKNKNKEAGNRYKWESLEKGQMILTKQMAIQWYNHQWFNDVPALGSALKGGIVPSFPDISGPEMMQEKDKQGQQYYKLWCSRSSVIKKNQKNPKKTPTKNTQCRKTDIYFKSHIFIFCYEQSKLYCLPVQDLSG